MPPVIFSYPETRARECGRQATYHFAQADYWCQTALRSVGLYRQDCMRAARLHLELARARRVEAAELRSSVVVAPVELKRAA